MIVLYHNITSLANLCFQFPPRYYQNNFIENIIYLSIITRNLGEEDKITFFQYQALSCSKDEWLYEANIESSSICLSLYSCISEYLFIDIYKNFANII